MTNTLRSLTGGTALVAGLCFLATGPAPADIPAEAKKTVLAADIAEIQKKVDQIAENPARGRGAMHTVTALALMIGESDPTLKAQASQVVAALEKKDYDAAKLAAKGLSNPTGAGAFEKFEYGLDDVMSPFRLDRSGGMDIEKSIREYRRAKAIEAKDAVLVGARAAKIAKFTVKMPTDKAKTNAEQTKKWERWTKDMGDAADALATEGAKGEKADSAKLLDALGKLDTSCVNCHNDFRD